MIREIPDVRPPSPVALDNHPTLGVAFYWRS